MLKRPFPGPSHHLSITPPSPPGGALMTAFPFASMAAVITFNASEFSAAFFFFFSQSKLLTANVATPDLRIAPDLALTHTNAKFKDLRLPLSLARKLKQSALISEQQRPAGPRVTVA